MARRIQLVIGRAAMMFDVVAIASFMLWLSKTDWLMGHTKGPPAYIFTALGTAAIGVIATIACFAMALYGKLASSRSTTLQSHLLLGITLGVLLLPACLIVLIAGSELPKAIESQRTRHLENLLIEVDPGDAKSVPALIRVLEQDKNHYHRSLAVQALERMGPAAKDAVPTLINALDGGDISVAIALARIGPAAVPALAKAVRENPGSPVRSGAASALRFMGPSANEAGPALQEALHDGNQDVRLAVAESLWSVTREGDDDLVMVLTEIVTGSDGKLSGQAARCLGAIGPAAKKATPALRVALRDSNAGVRCDAAFSLWRIEQDAEEVVPVLAELLEVPVQYPYLYNVPSTAALHLSHIGPGAEAAVPALTKALQQADGSVREPAAQALGSIGPAAKSAVPALIEAIKLSGPRSTKETGILVDALKSIDPEAASALDAR